MDKKEASHNCPKIDYSTIIAIDYSTIIANECGITPKEAEKAILDFLLAIEEVMNEEDQQR